MLPIDPFSIAAAPAGAALRRWAATAGLLCAAGVAMAQSSASVCGPLQNGYGPYDYRSDHDKRPIVEGAHFTAPVESLIKGNGGTLGGDIDYTLRAFPNHHRALISMMGYAERLKVTKVPNATYDVECYFERALRFRSDDTTVRMLYATFLGKKARRSEAQQQLETAKFHAGENPFTHYNIGLVYLELQDYEHALEEAHKAMALEFPGLVLKNRLVAAGKWVDPVAAPK